MRNLFFNELFKYAVKDSSIILLSCDMGCQALDKWRERLPSQYFNMGPAEQNAILVASGLAQQGMRPFVYGICAFLIYRAFDQIRIYLGHQRLPVVLVGWGAGTSYGPDAGITHHCELDAGMMMGLQIPVLVDQFDVKAIATTDVPLYLRMERG